MKKKIYLVPMAALSAFSTSALAKVGIEAPTAPAQPVDAVNVPVVQKAFQAAAADSLIFQNKGGEMFGHTLQRQEDGTMVAQHYSHASHASHASHRSHYSSRY